MANNKVLQTAVEIAGSISPSLSSAVEGAAKLLDKVNLKAVAVAAAAAAGAVAIVKGVAKASKALVELGSEFDDAYDTIRIGTGATGEALDALQDDFKAVYSSVPTTMEDAAKAISDYNTRLGLTGDNLQNLSKQAIQVADLLGEDLGTVIENSSKAFQEWHIDAEDMGAAMDYIFKVSQSTGVGFSELMESTRAYGAQLQELGYTFEESAAFIGQLEKAGVNTSEVLSAMKKSVTALANEGIGAADGLQLYIDAIVNAKDMTQATAIAAELFGTKAGSTMAVAIRDGTFNIEELTAALEANSETIAGCAEDTYDFAERLQVFKQQAQVALEPLAMTMFDSLNELMPIVGELMGSLIPIIQDMTKTLTPLIKDLVAKIGPMLQKLIPPIVKIASALLSKILPPLVEIISAVLSVAIQLVELLAPIIEFIADSILPVLVQVIAALLPPLMRIVQGVLPIFITLLETIVPILAEVISAILPVVLGLLDALTPVIEELAASVLPLVVDVIEQLLPPVLEIIKSVLPAATSLLKSLMPVIVSVANAVMPIINEILPMVVSLMQTLIPIIIKVINAVLPIIAKVLPAITKLLEAVLPLVMKLISAILPVVIQLLDTLTPILDLVIGLLSPILDLIIALVTPILDLISVALGPLIDTFSSLISYALEPLQPLIEMVASLFTGVLGEAMSSLQPLIEMVTNLFSGLMDFVKNVFTGNWSAAWDNVKNIFASVWEGIKNLGKGALNGLITAVESGINLLIKMINGLTGGLSKTWTWLGIPAIPEIPLVTLPRLATGGFTEGVSIAGEEGTEAVISFDPQYREANIKLWQESGKLLGVFDEQRLSESEVMAAATATLQTFNVENYPQSGVIYDIPHYAMGGFTQGISIAGEEGTEAVISFDPQYREANIETWQIAGKMLGVFDDTQQMNDADATPIRLAGQLLAMDDFSLGGLIEMNIVYYDFSRFQFAPQVEAKGNLREEDIIEVLRDQKDELMDWLERWLAAKQEGSYDRVSIY